MSAISAVAAASGPDSIGATQKKSNLDYQSFLTLLVAQLKNQDPTKPMDSTEYVAQLATFSNVEQAISANKKLDALIQDTRISQAIGLIGRHVSNLDGLGAGTVVDRLEIRWPAGLVESFSGLPADHLIHAEEGKGIIRRERFGAAR